MDLLVISFLALRVKVLVPKYFDPRTVEISKLVRKYSTNKILAAGKWFFIMFFDIFKNSIDLKNESSVHNVKPLNIAQIF